MTRRVAWLDALDRVPAEDWDALHDGRNPFVRHAFLAGLERHGCLRGDWGWTPRHPVVLEGDRLVAAAPGYIKHNSHGEFVFDHAWAHAYARAGLDYFPKWLCGVPYSPVTGPRLLAVDEGARRQLLASLPGACRDAGWSSCHVNFIEAAGLPAFGPEWLPRMDVQYHWRNTQGWGDFDGFLAAMDHKHRKNIRQERARVAGSGVRFRILHGDEATEADLVAMHGFYLQTFAEYGNAPALTLPFLHHLAKTMPRSLVLVLADLEGDTVAGALCMRGTDTLYGRYWGSHVRLPGLHFETCYYQGIAYCLREGLAVFEPGAQGEHKLARGFLPTPVHSRHWVADGRFREALADWCRHEVDLTALHARRMGARTPFKDPGGEPWHPPPG
ncbi:N-acetyltransferase [Lysobacter sp. SG-8]|uniref:N-acetyltransferase n=1 Tax=Marilutibacter penaei TaxID=2759900 RepID=A0A7W3U5F2_9GAMM|nr:GNAT family N-acetyltransferase [Lysobacter penaei]MBB1089292.1 N-acetyltransferase [Lysobacter penaei]